MNVLAELKNITTFVFDVDGVLTDGKVLLLPEEKSDKFLLARAMHTRDGFAMQLAIKKGYNIAIITGGNYEGVSYRLNALGITDIFSDIKEKLPSLISYVKEKNISAENILYMGDDVPDAACMQHCKIGACPADAVSDVKIIADYISPVKGGDGCVRDVIEKVLKLRGDWEMHIDIASK